VVEDDRGFGRPVSVALFKKEIPDSLKKFLDKFVANNPDWTSIKTLFVKKTFVQRHFVERTFRNARVCFHHSDVIARVKSQILKENVSLNEKLSILESFRGMIFSATEEDFQLNENAFLLVCPDSVKDYYLSTWCQSNKRFYLRQGNILELFCSEWKPTHLTSVNRHPFLSPHGATLTAKYAKYGC